MKKIIIYLGCVCLLLVSSCKDYLKVESLSKRGTEYVFGDKEEINRALTAVYEDMMSSSTYGNYMIARYSLNTDVEFRTYSTNVRSVAGSEFSCFDGTKYSSDIAGTWRTLYEGIERANIFIEGVESSPLFADKKDADLWQQLGEAKCLRAMFYHDMVVGWGDIPFRTKQSFGDENLNIGLTDRNEILTWLIEDLKSVGPKMMYASVVKNGVERINKNFCYGLIARMAMTRGGYSLYPNKNDPMSVGTMQRPTDYLKYYDIARTYADSVISSGQNSLTKSFRQVFIDECNYIVTNNDDPLFEIPFLKNSSGETAYTFGPSVAGDVNGFTPHPWGPSSGSGLTLHPLYLFTFDSKDLRRDFTVLTWNYNSLGVPTIAVGFTQRMGKWSKLWATAANALGSNSTSYTGVNYPYMRYAEVLLIYAEAVNELTGITGANGAKAKEALKQVRRRAFAPSDQAVKVEQYVNSLGSKDAFFQAIVKERAWEFGGENMRWKDLARWNLYSKVVYETYNAMKIIAWNAVGNPIASDWDNLPYWVFYRVIPNPNNINIYPNTQLQILELYKWPLNPGLNPGGTWVYQDWFQAWGNSTDAVPKNETYYSFRGYISGGIGSNESKFNPGNLPPVRYIFPIPNAIIVSHKNTFNNYYGYY
ncbi:MAG: RagB/SusD family nutrient uptake outer membrane protein [Prolixibacteraceae bacterium]